jgi:tRNA A-37 threonylcarbamoyl transferase component Bud32
METDTMAIARSALVLRDFAFPKTQTEPVTPGVWRRLFNAMIEARQRQVDREIARYLRSYGGKFTDQAEREIEERILGSRTRW